MKKLSMYTKKEHYSDFGTFEITSLVNVPGHYLRKYGKSVAYFQSIFIFLRNVIDTVFP